jgi:hypothetical protein
MGFRPEELLPERFVEVLRDRPDPGYPQLPLCLTLLNSDLLTLSDNEHSATIVIPNTIHKVRRKNLSVTILSALL